MIQRKHLLWTVAIFLLASGLARAGGERHLTYADIQTAIGKLKRQYPEQVQVESLGRTFEGREIPVLKISDRAAVDEEEPEVLFIGGCHPREQQPQVSLLRLAEDLLSPTAEPEVRRLVNEREIWLAPVLNVDGKIHDFTGRNPEMPGRDWRKNRRPLPGGEIGVDLNRNFGVRWGGNRQVNTRWNARSDDPKANIYEGPEAFSEPESRALAAFLERRPIRLFVDVHSPLKVLLHPSYLPKGEADRYQRLVEGMRSRQKTPYPGPARTYTGDTPPGERQGDTGLTYTWAYYTRGITSFNLEIGLEGRYPLPADSLREYAENLRGPLLYLLDEAGRVPVHTPGDAVLAGSRTDVPPAPGAVVAWTPEIRGSWEYAVLVSRSPAAVVQSELRRNPLAQGFTLKVQPDARPGGAIPLELYVWAEGHRRTLLRTELRVAGP